MAKFIMKRLLWMIPTLFGVILLVFLLLALTPGDPAKSILPSDEWTDENLARVHEELGLDDPFFVQLLRYLRDLVFKGDFGTSYVSKRSVAADMMIRFPYTLRVAFFSVALSVIIGIPIGVWAATNQYTLKDNFAVFMSLFCVSMPNFWFALLLTRFFAVQLGWLPTSGVEHWTGYILPCVSVGIGGLAGIVRQTRSSMLEAIRQDYVTTARAKGLAERKVIYNHALKNALIPIITVIGNHVAHELGGTLIAETIFSIPGLAKYLLTGLQQRDYPVIRGCVLYIAAVFAIVMTFVDIIYGMVDPRIRNQLIKKKSDSKKSEKKEAAAA